jgi:hypothetical protein
VPLDFPEERTHDSKTPAFRRARARLAAHALHHKRSDIAREAGRKGGEVTSQRYPLGPRAWGIAMSMRRWYGTALIHVDDLMQVGSRAPMAGSGNDGGGAPEPGPAPAHKRASKRGLANSCQPFLF